MKTLKLLLTISTILIGLSINAQETDSAFAMLSETVVSNNSSKNMNETEAITAKRLKTTKHANFRTSGQYTDVSQYLNENLEFPEEARILGKTGVVKVVFDILPNGSIQNIEILEAPLQVLSDELIKTLKAMPRWSPAYQSGLPVKTRQQLNVDFSLL